MPWTWKNVSGPGVEVQTDRTLSTIDAQDGDYYIELDSTANSSISQKVQLSQGTYLLSFWYSPRTALALTNTITYNLGRVVSGQITNGVNGARVGVWVEVKALFSIKSKGNYDLTFAAAGLSDGYGGLIDNVSETSWGPLTLSFAAGPAVGTIVVKAQVNARDGFVALSAGPLLAALDQTIVSTAMPPIPIRTDRAADLHPQWPAAEPGRRDFRSRAAIPLSRLSDRTGSVAAGGTHGPPEHRTP